MITAVAPLLDAIEEDRELLALSAAIVAPTSRSAAPATFRPEVEIDGEATRVLVEQLRAVDLDRLDRHAGRTDEGQHRARRRIGTQELPQRTVYSLPQTAR